MDRERIENRKRDTKTHLDTLNFESKLIDMIEEYNKSLGMEDSALVLLAEIILQRMHESLTSIGNLMEKPKEIGKFVHRLKNLSKLPAAEDLLIQMGTLVEMRDLVACDYDYEEKSCNNERKIRLYKALKDK